MDSVPARTNNLARLSQFGTSVWLDFVSRSLLQKGELQHMVEVDDVRGVTSNPSIFEKAIGHSDEYDADLIATEKAGDRSVSDLFDHLAIGDIQAAADVLRPVYERTDKVDGYISLEVSPYLALNTESTITEARRLWAKVGRPNLMVKVPGTDAGVPAIETLIGEGININVTLLFSIKAYQAVAEAYMTGLEALAAKGGDLHGMASVASFFVSRIDSLVDTKSAARLAQDQSLAADLAALRGKVAIANAKLAYQWYKQMIASPRWQALAAKGARPQRLLWASTGTKLKGLPDTLYVDTLIGPDTVNTMPPATMDATRDHGTAKATIEDGVDAARETLALLDRCGISLDDVTAELVVDGVAQFADAADKLYGAVAMKRAAFLGGKRPLQTMSLGSTALDQAVERGTQMWARAGLVRRLWAGDTSVWTGADEDQWLGWLGLVQDGIDNLLALQAFQQEVRATAYTDVVLLGMGGSSLGPEVLAQTLGSAPGFPTLHIVDSTDPAQLASVRDAITLAHTLFIVSSKSGSTLEPNIFKAYFFDLLRQHTDRPGAQFIAVTDPGSKVEAEATADGFAHVFHGLKSVGGRFSVLSMFGLVPAAAIGVDLPRFLDLAGQMVRSCGPDVPPAINPGVHLGITMGVAVNSGRDKVTLIASPGLADLGAWLEQLLAESTGKQGHGIVPIDLEPIGVPAAYGKDRLFAYLELADAPDATQRLQVDRLQDAGQPVIRITVPSRMHLGQEFFRWEIAVAVAGAVIGIDPFDQPDVEASKIATRKLTDQVESGGSLPAEQPVFEDDEVAIYADAANARALGKLGDLPGVLKSHLARAQAGDYVALLAYVERDSDTIAALQTARQAIRDKTRAATAVGFGPRFLHSTGQTYKGGPNSGVFIQITCDDQQDIQVPGHSYSFGVVKAAQARGDLQVLDERGRRAIRLHLKGELRAGLGLLNTALRTALA